MCVCVCAECLGAGSGGLTEGEGLQYTDSVRKLDMVQCDVKPADGKYFATCIKSAKAEVVRQKVALRSANDPFAKLAFGQGMEQAKKDQLLQTLLASQDSQLTSSAIHNFMTVLDGYIGLRCGGLSPKCCES